MKRPSCLGAAPGVRKNLCSLRRRFAFVWKARAKRPCLCSKTALWTQAPWRRTFYHHHSSLNWRRPYVLQRPKKPGKTMPMARHVLQSPDITIKMSGFTGVRLPDPAPRSTISASRTLSRTRYNRAARARWRTPAVSDIERITRARGRAPATGTAKERRRLTPPLVPPAQPAGIGVRAAQFALLLGRHAACGAASAPVDIMIFGSPPGRGSRGRSVRPRP